MDPIWRNLKLASSLILHSSVDTYIIVASSSAAKSTVWKFQNFYVTQILCVINFGDSRSAKSAILSHLIGLNLYFYEFLHFLKAKIYLIKKIQGRAPKMKKMAVLQLLDSPTLISRKIWMTQKSWNFHTVKSELSLFQTKMTFACK